MRGSRILPDPPDGAVGCEPPREEQRGRCHVDEAEPSDPEQPRLCQDEERRQHQRRPGKTLLAFTEGAEETVAELAECFPDDSLVPVTVELSGQELEAIVARMAADRELIGSGELRVPAIANDRYDMAAYPRGNAVLVWLEELDPETIAAFKRRYGEALFFRELKGG